jgi:hypothetical protein
MPSRWSILGMMALIALKFPGETRAEFDVAQWSYLNVAPSKPAARYNVDTTRFKRGVRAGPSVVKYGTFLLTFITRPPLLFHSH